MIFHSKLLFPRVPKLIFLRKCSLHASQMVSHKNEKDLRAGDQILILGRTGLQKKQLEQFSAILTRHVITGKTALVSYYHLFTSQKFKKNYSHICI